MMRKLKTTPWKDIKNKKLSPDAQARVQERVTTALEELPLQELRRARALSQVTLAELLNTTQPEVSKIEHRADLYVSTLRRYVEAMGGELDIVARFPDGSVRINQFEEIEAA